MLSFETETQICAPPERVWAVLIDLAQWPQWDPFCERIAGNAQLGSTVKVYTRLSPGRAFPVKVSTLHKPSRMVWRGGMPLGLFTGERTYLLSPQDGGTHFSMREQFTGLLSPLIGRTIPDMNEAFRAFAAGLKARSEAG